MTFTEIHEAADDKGNPTADETQKAAPLAEARSPEFDVWAKADDQLVDFANGAIRHCISKHKSKVIRDGYFHRSRHIICFTHEDEFVSAPVSSS
ncbi:hypothetical protein MGG_15959 [Pyricularia oryzae 70-15]|uniref:Uncharacterized protein n=1 Tax=Pyricularia oryzae (strain 70-15 / ATCC MYA-4617 / FGSC 8958) TaxID=242507 RepID=G4MXA2_PYRO7|nr:uncharacterized protein MGG_15959 [Pyricularia oryzae 70-15]EHA56000.1 hypothetical protein MGG_15959 [Pyricularia oryzae 70-15]